MQILAIDTATEICSIALWNNGEIYSSFRRSLKGHSKYILPLVKKILYESKITLKDLDALAFTHGPGSFTGVRLGMSCATGLALGVDCPVVSVSTLVTLAQGVWRNTGLTRVLTAIDARMGEIYWAEYVFDKEGVWLGRESEAVLKPKEISKRLKTLSGKWVTAGTGWKILEEISDQYKHFVQLQSCNLQLPLAEDILPIACQLVSDKKTLPVEKTTPIYLRNEIAKKI